MCVCVCVCVCVRERERERERERSPLHYVCLGVVNPVGTPPTHHGFENRESLHVHLYMYNKVCTYMYTYLINFYFG